jgi:hypothetical protein
MNPKYPIYIPSKGRADRPLTATRLKAMGVPFRIVVEEHEANDYAFAVGVAPLLVLPFSNLGQGSIPARNWIWEHAAKEGHERHWIIDDNIVRFYRLNLNRRIPVATGTIFACAEEFTDRYENIALSGFNNIAFAPDREPSLAPFTLNTRIYSMTLIKTSLPYRWRGRYNEDTDLCLRALKDGWVTVQFNAFLGDKATTMTMRGGNTDTVYNTGDDRRAFAESLAEQHPDVARVTWKFDRWHHEVDYSPFRGNALRLRSGVVPTKRVDEHGMVLRRLATWPAAGAPHGL